MALQFCRTLLMTWILAITGILLMAKFGHIGILMAAIPLGIAQNMRLVHDKEMYMRIRNQVGWMIVFLSYYVFLLVITILVLGTNFRFDDLPMAAFILIIMLPIFVAMFVNDIRTCLGKRLIR